MRLSRSVDPARIMVITHHEQRLTLLGQLKGVYPQITPHQVLGEPDGRDSGPAVLWGLLTLQRMNPAALAVVVWADMHIGQEILFDEALQRASTAAHAGGLVMIGAKPHHAATNLGYIQYTDQADSNRMYPVTAFVEKPPLEQARAFVTQGNYAWNIGIFCFAVNKMVEVFKHHAPKVYFLLSQAPCSLTPASPYAQWDMHALGEAYQKVEKISIDYLLFEKCAHALKLTPVDMGWSDLGLWDEIHKQRPQDQHGNSTSGKVLLQKSSHCLVQGGKRLIAGLGLKNIAIIDTDDALLVLNLRHAQDVKVLVAQLQTQGYAAATQTENTLRPWGYYNVLVEGAGFKVKELVVTPKQKMSLQLHHHRAEYWVVVEGHACLTCGEETKAYTVGDALFIPTQTKHRIANPHASITLKIIEVQTGDYLEEDDIVRFEDDYQRV